MLPSHDGSNANVVLLERIRRPLTYTSSHTQPSIFDTRYRARCYIQGLPSNIPSATPLSSRVRALKGLNRALSRKIVARLRVRGEIGVGSQRPREIGGRAGTLNLLNP